MALALPDASVVSATAVTAPLKLPAAHATRAPTTGYPNWSLTFTVSGSGNVLATWPVWRLPETIVNRLAGPTVAVAVKTTLSST